MVDPNPHGDEQVITPAISDESLGVESSGSLQSTGERARQYVTGVVDRLFEKISADRKMGNSNKPSGPNYGRLILVKKGDSRACVFNNLDTIRNCTNAPATLSSHEGFGICKMWEGPRSYQEWRYIDLAIRPAD